MRKLVLETTSPFQGLPELVAFNDLVNMDVQARAHAVA